jgi:hypothetical protein
LPVACVPIALHTREIFADAEGCSSKEASHTALLYVAATVVPQRRQPHGTKFSSVHVDTWMKEIATVDSLFHFDWTLNCKFAASTLFLTSFYKPKIQNKTHVIFVP